MNLSFDLFVDNFADFNGVIDNTRSLSCFLYTGHHYITRSCQLYYVGHLTIHIYLQMFVMYPVMSTNIQTKSRAIEVMVINHIQIQLIRICSDTIMLIVIYRFYIIPTHPSIFSSNVADNAN